MTYAPPLADFGFILKHQTGIDEMRRLGHEVTPELVDEILAAAGALAAESFAPLNYSGDTEGARLRDGEVTTPKGYKEAYRAFAEGGWNAVPFPAEIGGMGLPWPLAFAVQEMFQAANISLALATLLNQGAIELLSTHGDPEIKARYLDKLVAGSWTGTMNLTEPQAGSDVGAVRATATPEDNHYRIKGQKIFISYGDHDMAENILHFVLARLPDAPEGSAGLSLFLVPKILVKPDGSLGKPNDVRTVSIEHKLGQHGSPTCLLAFGDEGHGAFGYLIGKAHGGMAAMFTMMNNARIGVGIQGLALADRAYQAASGFAKTRLQGRDARVKDGPPAAIIAHADVRRMLGTMRCQIEAGRALVAATGLLLDRMRHAPGADAPADDEARVRLELHTPVVKAWLTDLANEATSTAIQVFGGMGYIEEVGVAQHYRDARVLAIYEGTNGIQANDLVFRKLKADGGGAVFAICAEVKRAEHELGREVTPEARAIRTQLSYARTDLEVATQAMVGFLNDDRQAAAAGAAHYLRLLGILLGGLYLTRAAVTALGLLSETDENEHKFLHDKVTTARFYAEQILPQTTGLRMTIAGGHSAVSALDADYF